MAKPKFPIWAEINLGDINANLDLISRTAKVPMLPVIKANAYGHGAVELYKEISRHSNVAGLSVGTVGEALELRRAGYKKRLVILDGFLPNQVPDIINSRSEVVVSSIENIRLLARLAGREPVPVHIKINTGMTRLGADPDGAVEFYKKTARVKKIGIAGVMTHLADSGTKANAQISLFNETLSAIRSCGFTLPQRHAANTSAIFLNPKASYDMVRPGIGIYGVQNFAGKNVALKPALSLRARIMMVREVAKGATVSYGMTWTAQQKRVVAVVCAGYADGYSRSLSNKAHAIIKGIKIRQIGTICMDNSLFDVTGTGAKAGDVVTLIGSDKSKNIPVTKIAKLAGTISYEILCGIGRRVTRVYTRSGKVFNVSGEL
ncbi:Alanine racemase [hydrothermal vent metagenome]|uniref:Alanine racemase n=1 Tax=hydrothermal vent metagenome TaxID=652676 RepID=A0A3B1C497_9ZZZZ